MTYVRFIHARRWHLLDRPGFTLCGKPVTLGTQERTERPATQTFCYVCDTLKDWRAQQKEVAR